MKLARSIMLPIGILLLIAAMVLVVFFMGICICCDEILVGEGLSQNKLHSVSLKYSEIMSITCFTLSFIVGVLVAVCADLRLRIESLEIGIDDVHK